jgi:hypothetical protein
MNKTSTDGSGWKWDCDHFAQQGEAFILTKVTSPEHEAFCNGLSANHKLRMQREGNTITFTPSPEA